MEQCTFLSAIILHFSFLQCTVESRLMLPGFLPAVLIYRFCPSVKTCCLSVYLSLILYLISKWSDMHRLIPSCPTLRKSLQVNMQNSAAA